MAPIIHVIGLGFIPILYYLWAPLLTNIHFELDTFDNAEAKAACEDCANGYFYMVNKITVPLAIIMILGQIAFVVNIIVGFIRGKKHLPMIKSSFLKTLLRPETTLILIALAYATAMLVPYSPDTAIDIHLHDTYYIIARGHIYLLMAFLIALVAVIYFLTRRFRQWPFLQYFHIACIVIFQLSLSINRFYLVNEMLDERGTAFSAIVFFIGNVAFLVNLTAGFIRGKKSPTPIQ